MNTSRWLRLSLGVNLALFGLLLWPSKTSTNTPPSGPKEVLSSPAVAPIREPQSLAPEPPRKPSSWAESMAQLRRAGVPSRIIAQVVMEKMAQKWSPLETEMEQQYLQDKIDSKRLAERHAERAREEEAELRAALGDGYLAWHKEHTVETMYLGGLDPSEEQKAQLYLLQKDWLQRVQDLELAQRNGNLDTDAFEKKRSEAERDYKTRLAAIIGPERVDGLVAPDPLRQVREDFQKLKLNAAQMNQLADVYRKWNDVRADMDQSLVQTKTMDKAYEGDLQALDRARDEDYRKILGDETFQAWQRAGDDRYLALRRKASEWNLPEPVITQVYSTIRAYDLAVANEEYQGQLREQQGQKVGWTTVNRDISGYTRQTESTLRRYLGDERFQYLRDAQIFSVRESGSARSGLEARSGL